MNPQRFARIDEVFSAAADLAAAERPAFLARACGGDAELRRTVEQLLDAERKGESLFRQPIGRPPTGWEELGAVPVEDAESRAAAAALGTRVGRIRLLELIGIGGMGAVYAGFDEGLGRRVAVKRLRNDRHDARSRSRLLQEARLLSRLNHPNICQIYDLLEGDEHDHLVLELIEGQTLRQVVDDRIEASLALQIAEQIASALAAAHAEGIVHRDLKPENIMIGAASGRAGRRVKVLDFGIARLSELRPESGTRTALRAGVPAGPTAADGSRIPPRFTPRSALAGTPRYMSPEQRRGEPATAASDVYALGLVLLELITGRPAPESRRPEADAGDLRDAAARAPEPFAEAAIGWPRRRAARVKGELGALIVRLLSTAPAARPTAFDAMERLRWIRGAAGRRLRRLLTAAAVTLLALFAAAMGFLARETGRQARQATAQRLTAQSTLHLDSRLDLALLLALEAHRTTDVIETRSALLSALETSPRLRRYLHGHPQFVSGVAWSSDGRALASVGTMEGVVKLWDPATGSVKLELDTGQDGALAIAWSPDGRLLATGGMDGTVRLWDPATGSARALLRGHEMNLWALAWTGDSRLIASAAQDQTIRLWDVKAALHDQAEACRAILRGHDNAIWAVAWSPAGELLASAGSDGTVRLWDASGRPHGAPLRGHRGAVTGLAWSGDGRLLASSSRDGTIRLWDPLRGESVGAPLRAYEEPLETLAWSRARGVLAAGADDGTVQLWDPADRRPLGRPLTGHSGGLTGLAWSPDGGALVSAARDRSLVLWSLDEGGDTGPFEGHQATVTQLAISPEGHTLASAGWDQTVRLWNRSDGRPLGEPLTGHTGAIFGLAWSADSRFLATGGIDWTVRVWDAALGVERAVLRGHQGVVAAVAWHADGSTLASGSWDGTVGLWDVATGRLRRLEGHEGHVTRIAWHADGLLASAGSDGVVRLWSAAGQPVGELVPRAGQILGLAWRGDRLAIFAADTAQIWDTTSSERITTLADTEEATGSPVWNRDGTLVAAAGRRIHLWDVGSGQLLARFSSHRGQVLSLAFSTDGRLYSGGADGIIRVRDAGGAPTGSLAGGHMDGYRQRACRRAGRNLTPEEWRLYLGPEVPYRLSCPDLATLP